MAYNYLSYLEGSRIWSILNRGTASDALNEMPWISHDDIALWVGTPPRWEMVATGGRLISGATFSRASTGTTEITPGVFTQAAVDVPRYQWVTKRALGTELAVNGQFTAGTTGWNTSQGGSIRVVSGELQLKSTKAAFGGSSQTIPVVVGTRYAVKVKARRGTANNLAWVVLRGASGTIAQTVDTQTMVEYSSEFVATTTSLVVGFQTYSVVNADVFCDDVRVYAITDTSARALLVEPAATNLMWPSDTAVTKSIPVSAGSYTLSFYGTGTVSLSGAATGDTVGVGAVAVVRTVVATAGALTLTISGAVSRIQLESGVYATSNIVTTSGAVTRAADIVIFPVASFGFNASVGTFAGEFITPKAASVMLSCNGPLVPEMFTRTTSGFHSAWTGVNTYSQLLTTTASAVATAYDGSGITVCMNGHNPNVSSTPFDTLTGVTQVGFGAAGGVGGVQIPLQVFDLTYIARKISAGECVAMTTLDA